MKFLFAFAVMMSCASYVSGAIWPGRDYTEVRVFYYNAEGIPAQQFIENGKITDSVVNKSGIRLSPSQIDRVFRAMHAEYKRRTNEIMVFSQPQHAIAFFNPKHQIVAFIQLDFCCANYVVSPKHTDFSALPDYPALAEICAELKVPPFNKKTTKLYRRGFEESMIPVNKTK